MRLTGWSLDQIADTPAQRLDWLLAMDRAAGEVSRRLAEDAQKDNQR